MARKHLACNNAPKCKNKIRRDTLTGFCQPCWQADRVKAATANRSDAPVQQQVVGDTKLQRTTKELTDLRKRYDHALEQLAGYARVDEAKQLLDTDIKTFTIEPKKPSGEAEATAVMVASDWHIEETVGAEVGGLNQFNLAIANERVLRFFKAGHRILVLLKQDVSISHVILPLLGDFISSDIHEEFPETNGLLPMHALVQAQTWIASGIQFLLDNSDVRLTIPCHSGNHARTTKTVRFGAENGHSLEYLMYKALANHFRHEPRVTFIISAGMHSYVKVYDQTIRFQHGHAIKYGGGVGGIYIPVNKSIAQWNKARHADLDVFGHFHQLRDGGNFICNGSLIGYNAFALSIKADYEPPKQALFLIDKKRGRTCTWPLLVGGSQ